MTRVSGVTRGWLGWCPNHPVVAAHRPTIGFEIYVIVAMGILIIPAAALLMSSPAPQNVAVWAFRMDDTRTRHFVERLPATEDCTGKLTFSTAGATTLALPSGNYWLVIEHPGRDGRYRLTLDGAVVESQISDSANNGMKFFTVNGPGSLAGEDAYEALMAAYNGGMYVTGSTIPAGSGVTEREYTVGS
jgi:hypothetical protein